MQGRRKRAAYCRAHVKLASASSLPCFVRYFSRRCYPPVGMSGNAAGGQLQFWCVKLHLLLTTWFISVQLPALQVVTKRYLLISPHPDWLRRIALYQTADLVFRGCTKTSQYYLLDIQIRAEVCEVEIVNLLRFACGYGST